MNNGKYETNVYEIRNNLMDECRALLKDKSFHYSNIDDEIHVTGFSPEIIIQVLRNGLDYPSPLLFTMLDIRGTESNTIISLKV